MPQLDQISFLSQLTWLCIFYFGFHLILVDNFLPKISTILKLRKKKLLNSLSSSFASQTEGSFGNGSQVQENQNETDILKNYDFILTQSVQQSENSVQKGISEKSQWTNQFVKKLNSENWNKLNNFYLKRLATMRANQNVIYTNLSLGSPISFEFFDKINNVNLNQKNFQSEQFHIQMFKNLMSSVSLESKENLKNKNFLKKGNKTKLK